MTAIRRAVPPDESALLVLIEEFYEIDRHEFDLDRVLRGLRPLLDDDAFGQVWLIEPQVGRIDGYAVITWSWSLESGGRDCILDELYVRRREKGVGSAALEEITAAAARAGARAMFLETEEHNARARSFYARSGFRVENSVWMARSLPLRDDDHGVDADRVDAVRVDARVGADPGDDAGLHRQPAEVLDRLNRDRQMP